MFDSWSRILCLRQSCIQAMDHLGRTADYGGTKDGRTGDVVATSKALPGRLDIVGCPLTKSIGKPRDDLVTLDFTTTYNLLFALPTLCDPKTETGRYYWQRKGSGESITVSSISFERQSRVLLNQVLHRPLGLCLLESFIDVQLTILITSVTIIQLGHQIIAIIATVHCLLRLAVITTGIHRTGLLALGLWPRVGLLRAK